MLLRGYVLTPSSYLYLQVGERALPSLGENSRPSRSRLSRTSPDATASQYRVSSEVELVSDLCRSRAKSYHSPFPLLFHLQSLFLPNFSLFFSLLSSLRVSFAGYLNPSRQERPILSSSRLILFRRAVRSRSAFVLPVCLSDTRDIHIHTHGNTQCHSVELLPVGKAKISLQATVPSGDRPPPPPTPPPTPDSPASAGKCTRFLHEGNQHDLFETVSTRI